MPKISVVIASKVGAPFIDQCLDSIQNEVASLEAEAVVVTPRDQQYVRRLQLKYPWVKVVQEPSVMGVPALRRRGVEEATGEYVAIIEEHCSAAPDWLRQALAAFRRGPYAAVGGAITDYRYDRLRDWVVYFIEYNSSLPPVSAGETYNLNDANIAYPRGLLLEHRQRLDEGYWPMALHPALAAQGERFLSVPEMVVYHRGPFDFFYYLHQRFLFSRAFAGVRARHQSPARRLAYLVAAPIVPVMLVARMAKAVLSKGRRVPEFIRTLPLIIPAVTVLVAGEWVGCLLGPGNALSEVE
jgi:glycosyltransferase involved in cell wall biosynthesis